MTLIDYSVKQLGLIITVMSIFLISPQADALGVDIDIKIGQDQGKQHCHQSQTPNEIRHSSPFSY